MTQDVHVPSAGKGGLGSSSQAPTGSIGFAYEDEDEDKVDQRHEELSPSQLQDAPSTQLIQPSGTRQCRPLDPYTSGTSTLGQRVRVRLGDSEGLW